MDNNEKNQQVSEILKNEVNKTSLPREVYYQCIWVIKDKPRLENLALRLLYAEECQAGEPIIFVDKYDGVFRDDVMAEAKFKLECIDNALEKIPQEYRSNIIDNIVNMQAFDDKAHTNTWKRWKQIFICNLARNLKLY